MWFGPIIFLLAFRCVFLLTPPIEWDCPGEDYGTDNGYCGAWDPDCDGVTDPEDIYNCPQVGELKGCLPPNGTCDYYKPSGPWDCPDSWYNQTGSCHCQCGSWDPGCDDPQAKLLHCPETAIRCSSITALCVFQYVVPSNWTDSTIGQECDPLYYDAGDGCDCDCGAYDPDCDSEYDPESTLFGCNIGAIGCSKDSRCIYQDVPEEWECDSSYFNVSDGCDCNCGIPDPDCQDPQAEIYRCLPGAYACVDAICKYHHPPTWNCRDDLYDISHRVGRYAPGSECNCGCGAMDPDCLLPGVEVKGCPCPGMECVGNGVCRGECNGSAFGLAQTEASLALSSALESEVKGMTVGFVVVLVVAVIEFVVICIAVVIVVLWYCGKCGGGGKGKEKGSGFKRLEEDGSRSGGAGGVERQLSETSLKESFIS